MTLPPQSTDSTRAAGGGGVRPRRTITDMLAQARGRIDRLDPSAALSAAEEGALLIDTRCTEQRRETGTFPGSVHVPLSVLYWRLDPASGYEDRSLADPGRQVILFCAHGYSSSIAAATLRDLGFARGCGRPCRSPRASGPPSRACRRRRALDAGRLGSRLESFVDKRSDVQRDVVLSG